MLGQTLAFLESPAWDDPGARLSLSGDPPTINVSSGRNRPWWMPNHAKGCLVFSVLTLLSLGIYAVFWFLIVGVPGSRIQVSAWRVESERTMVRIVRSKYADLERMATIEEWIRQEFTPA